ncbi:MAG TPA: hypothetical protein VFN61_02160 [Acidimicrobiales bacterium]|nr:hypothetical protein [Acidimicrobiales bacterium]
MKGMLPTVAVPVGRTVARMALRVVRLRALTAASRREGRRAKGSPIGHEMVVTLARRLLALAALPLIRHGRCRLVGAA